MLFGIFAALVSVWLFFKIIKIAVKVAWCFAKFFSVILCVIALPLLAVFIITAGGFLLLLPVILLVVALIAIRSC